MIVRKCDFGKVLECIESVIGGQNLGCELEEESDILENKYSDEKTFFMKE